MTAEDKINYPQARPITLSPWLVIVGALLLYGLTLNHWVSSKPAVDGASDRLGLASLLAEVASGAMAPLFLVLTAPVRLLPAAWQPMA
jgi:hypothetical protein